MTHIGNQIDIERYDIGEHKKIVLAFIYSLLKPYFILSYLIFFTFSLKKYMYILPQKYFTTVSANSFFSFFFFAKN